PSRPSKGCSGRSASRSDSATPSDIAEPTPSPDHAVIVPARTRHAGAVRIRSFSGPPGGARRGAPLSRQVLRKPRRPTASAHEQDLERPRGARGTAAALPSGARPTAGGYRETHDELGGAGVDHNNRSALHPNDPSLYRDAGGGSDDP